MSMLEHGKVFNAAVYLLKLIYPMTQPSLTAAVKQTKTYVLASSRSHAVLIRSDIQNKVPFIFADITTSVRFI